MITVIHQTEDVPFLGLIFETSEELEAKLRMRLVLGTSPETLTRNHHLSLLVFKTPPSDNREVRYAIVPSLVGSIVLRKNKRAKVCLPMSVKLCDLNHFSHK